MKGFRPDVILIDYADIMRSTRQFDSLRHELKLVYPQADADPAAFVGLAFQHRFLQPMDGPDRAASTEAAIAYCRRDARWRLSLQTHKMIGVK